MAQLPTVTSVLICIVEILLEAASISRYICNLEVNLHGFAQPHRTSLLARLSHLVHKCDVTAGCAAVEFS